MINRITTLSAAVLCLLASPLRAQPSEALRLSADSLSASFGELSVAARQARAAALGARIQRARFVPRTDSLPENCFNLPVVAIRNGEIFKNGEKLGRNASSYQANCDGLVAWRDSYGDLYADTRKIADRVSEYDVAWHGDVLVWKDSHGDLHRGTESLGRVSNYTFVKFTGDVVWKDSWGDLYRNREKFGRAGNYRVAARTGDVAWQDSYGILHLNARELGRSQSWQISDRTGTVGWIDSFRNLYKNGDKVGSDVSQFTMREDGKLIWVDSWGNTHYA